MRQAAIFKLRVERRGSTRRKKTKKRLWTDILSPGFKARAAVSTQRDARPLKDASRHAATRCSFLIYNEQMGLV